MRFGKACSILRLLLAGALLFNLAACGDSPDEEAPELTLDDITTPTPSPDLSLSGKVEEGAVVEVKVRETNLGAASPPEAGKWQAAVSLEEGNNIIEITATDSAGNTNLIRRTVVLDTKGPVLTSPAEGASVAQSDTLTLVFNEPVAGDNISASVNGSFVLFSKSADSASTFIGTPAPSLVPGQVTLVLPAGILDTLENTSIETTRKFTVSEP